MLSPIVFLIIVLFLAAYFKSAHFKGKVGETFVNMTASLSLNEDRYTILRNLTFRLEDGSTTQIDHIVLSQYGVFVIETKNMKGWIFGSASNKVWTQQLFKKKFRFQNPLHQNYRHVKALEEVLTVNERNFFSVIVFIGESTFKTKMPENVFNGLNYTDYIRSFDEVLFNDAQVRLMTKKLQRNQIKANRRTDKEHIQNLQRKHG